MRILILVLAFGGAAVFASLLGTRRKIDPRVYELLPYLYLFCSVIPLILFPITGFLLFSCLCLFVSSIYILQMRKQARSRLARKMAHFASAPPKPPTGATNQAQMIKSQIGKP